MMGLCRKDKERPLAQKWVMLTVHSSVLSHVVREAEHCFPHVPRLTLPLS